MCRMLVPTSQSSCGLAVTLIIPVPPRHSHCRAQPRLISRGSEKLVLLIVSTPGWRVRGLQQQRFTLVITRLLLQLTKITDKKGSW